MRMSASGLESTMAVAIDQIFRFAPSINPPIEPVVSSTKATSTVGFATAADRPAERGRAVRARTKAWVTMRGIVISSSVLSLGTKVPRLRGRLRAKSWRAGYIIAAYLASTLWSMIRKSGYRFSEKIMLKQKDALRIGIG